MIALSPQRADEATARPRRAGLVLRVSTDRQAQTAEGSLTTQRQRLRQHIAYKRDTVGESWDEVAIYELRAVSGKDSLRSPEFQRLFADIRAGRVDTILCTALDRICRSVKDFLHFFEVLNEHGVEFVCLKQNYDTTSPQGRLFVMIMMALAEFEREQTADRTREATAARSERGLWSGGRLLGYDLDANRKGYLIPNEVEAGVVNTAFETYLECGSIAETAATLSRLGYRTKSYTSRREVYHPPKEFSTTSVQHLLKNVGYIGKKAIAAAGNRRDGSEIHLVPAVWPGIVAPETFQRVQALMEQNGRTNRNGAKSIRHVHVLSGGLLRCGRCGSAMESRSGTGRLGKTYFYYVCTTPACGLRVGAPEIESAVLGRLGELAEDEARLGQLVTATNQRLRQQAGTLSRRRRTLAKDLAGIKTEAAGLLQAWAPSAGAAGEAFVKDRLGELERRQQDLEKGLAEVESALATMDSMAVSAEEVRQALMRADAVYAELKPYEKKDLVQLLLHKAEVGDREIIVELRGGACGVSSEGPGTSDLVSSRSEPVDWLPGQDSNLRPSG